MDGWYHTWAGHHGVDIIGAAMERGEIIFLWLWFSCRCRLAMVTGYRGNSTFATYRFRDVVT